MDLLGNEWITQSGLLYWNEFEVLLDYEVLFPPKILMPPTFGGIWTRNMEAEGQINLWKHLKLLQC